jgi:CheY-like chemotaxis protein
MPLPSPSPSSRDPGAQAPRRGVLIVDDDRDIRETLQEILEQEGYEVATAKDGLDALETARDERPAIILLDLFMPVMDGLEFRRRQLLDPALAEIPVVVVSAAAGIEDSISALGVAAHLEKPLRIEQLFEVVARYCG